MASLETSFSQTHLPMKELRKWMSSGQGPDGSSPLTEGLRAQCHQMRKLRMFRKLTDSSPVNSRVQGPDTW